MRHRCHAHGCSWMARIGFPRHVDCQTTDCVDAFPIEFTGGFGHGGDYSAELDRIYSNRKYPWKRSSEEEAVSEGIELKNKNREGFISKSQVLQMQRCRWMTECGRWKRWVGPQKRLTSCGFIKHDMHCVTHLWRAILPLVANLFWHVKRRGRTFQPIQIIFTVKCCGQCGQQTGTCNDNQTARNVVGWSR